MNGFEQQIKRGLKRLSTDISTALNHAFVESVRRFYAAYNPSSYNRTYSTYEASKKHNKKCGYMQYKCGIIVDPANISGNPYAKTSGWGKSGLATPEYIFPRTFDKGIHGFTRGIITATKIQSINGEDARVAATSWRPWSATNSNNKKSKMQMIPKKSSPPIQYVKTQYNIIGDTIMSRLEEIISRAANTLE